MDTWLAQFVEESLEKRARDDEGYDLLTSEELTALTDAAPLEKKASVASTALDIGKRTAFGGATGASIGATGGAIGSEKGKRWRSALKGALIGSAIGASVGATRGGLAAATGQKRSLSETAMAASPKARAELAGARKGLWEQMKKMLKKEKIDEDVFKASVNRFQTAIGQQQAQGFGGIKRLTTGQKALATGHEALEFGAGAGAFEAARRYNKKKKEASDELATRMVNSADSVGRSFARLHTEEIMSKTATVQPQSIERKGFIQGGCDLGEEMEKSAEKYHRVGTLSGSRKMGEREMMGYAQKLNRMGAISSENMAAARKSPQERTSFLTSDAFLEPFWQHESKVMKKSASSILDAAKMTLIRGGIGTGYGAAAGAGVGAATAPSGERLDAAREGAESGALIGAALGGGMRLGPKLPAAISAIIGGGRGLQRRQDRRKKEKTSADNRSTAIAWHVGSFNVSAAKKGIKDRAHYDKNLNSIVVTKPRFLSNKRKQVAQFEIMPGDAEGKAAIRFKKIGAKKCACGALIKSSEMKCAGCGQKHKISAVVEAGGKA